MTLQTLPSPDARLAGPAPSEVAHDPTIPMTTFPELEGVVLVDYNTGTVELNDVFALHCLVNAPTDASGDANKNRVPCALMTQSTKPELSFGEYNRQRFALFVRNDFDHGQLKTVRQMVAEIYPGKEVLWASGETHVGSTYTSGSPEPRNLTSEKVMASLPKLATLLNTAAPAGESTRANQTISAAKAERPRWKRIATAAAVAGLLALAAL